jgi:dihydroorotase
MTILIKQARITDPSSPHNGQTADVFIENGVITGIAPSISQKADQEININGLHLSPGWVDIFSHFSDPGYEFKETLETGAHAAAAGGFTDVLVIPNTSPVTQSKAGVEYIIQKSRLLPVTIHPIGAVTKNAEGKELAEMYDMKNSGAVAFSDGLHPLQQSGLLVKALQYTKAFDGVIIQVPDDKSINPHGLINEGIVSTRLGLPGKPAMAEELIVARDIKLTRYAGSRLHFTGVSTKKSVDYIQRGKSGGTQVTSSVTPYHLWFSDEDLADYNTMLKVNPPLRSTADRDALREAVSNGSIDIIASHHIPHETDSKVLEFESAKDGMTGLETAYAAVNTILPNISQEQWVSLFSINPRRIFGLEEVTIKVGANAILTLFEPAKKWTFRKEHTASRSFNSPFYGTEFTGKAAGIINGNKIQLSR